MISLANNIYSCFKNKGEFTLKDAYSKYSDKPKETVRARIYDNLGVKFERIAKGLYKTVEGDESCVLIEGDGRDLSMLNDSSIDCILTDHPWLDKKSNKGGDRNFATYDCWSPLKIQFSKIWLRLFALVRRSKWQIPPVFATFHSCHRSISLKFS